MSKNPDETPDELKNAVKSDDQAQLPAGPQLAERQETRAQSMTQSPTSTQRTVQWTIAEHESWAEKLKELRAERDSEARVVCMFVLENDWDMAASCARRYAKTKDELREHLGLLPPSSK